MYPLNMTAENIGNNPPAESSVSIDSMRTWSEFQQGTANFIIGIQKLHQGGDFERDPDLQRKIRDLGDKPYIWGSVFDFLKSSALFISYDRASLRIYSACARILEMDHEPEIAVVLDAWQSFYGIEEYKKPEELAQPSDKVTSERITEEQESLPEIETSPSRNVVERAIQRFLYPVDRMMSESQRAESRKEYIHDRFRSPEITRQTFEQGLPDVSGITIEDRPVSEAGGTSIVWKGRVAGGLPGLQGRATTDAEVPIVVKAPKGLEENVLEIIEEAYTLQAIREAQRRLYPETRSFVPDSVLIQDFRGAPALAEEYARDIAVPSRLTPEQRRSVCVQFFKLQHVMHEAGIAQTDRKPSDLSYDANQDRLVVLDWNVNHPLQRPPTIDDIRLINNDLSNGLDMFPYGLGYPRSPDTMRIFSSLKEEINAQLKTAPFDVTKIIRTIEQLPLEAWEQFIT